MAHSRNPADAYRVPRWPFIVVATTCIGVIAARMFWPKIHFDTTSLILLSIAFVAFLIPFLDVKRLKWGDFELELQGLVDDLEKTVTATESSISEPNGQGISRAHRSRRDDTGSTWQKYFDDYSQIIQSSVSNTEKILAAAILIERMIETVAADFDLQLRPGGGPRATVSSLLTQGLITADEIRAFHDFWAIRNRIVHGGAEPTDDITARILELGWRLVRVFA
ncbi:hypothetical protein [Methyloversatilis sp. XJ19-49]|uniref:hypothetical protein n=1 Tax=Methyloversatilis sp. XJ19-49 TaxID=2963429 RepID=UPI00211CAD39|nr:hypothetical protein [Methyloversatilis sp. XJ19-49]MCQ9377752.1 hypothetical protein [Methyloversatilis sp. XJ19-49]